MGRRISGRQAFLLVAPFPPLALFKIWASAGRPGGALLAGSALMLAYCVFVIVLARRWDKPTYFDITACAYFSITTVSLLFLPGSAAAFLERYPVTGIYASLFCAAFLPTILGKPPFIEHYARKFAPESVWDNPVFRRINRIMAFVWAAMFGVSTFLSLYPSAITRAYIPLALILGVGVPFNIRFPDRYLRHLGIPSLAEQKKTMR